MSDVRKDAIVELIGPSPWAWWQNALSGVRGPITEDAPQTGYYRCRRKGEQATAVAYWRDTNDGAMRCKVAARDVPELQALELWPFASKEPITFEAYKAKRETGRWPDMDETVQPERRGMGDNQPPEETEAEAIKRQIEAASGGAAQYAKIADLETKAKAQSLRSRLLELAGSAKKIHKRLKDPLWEQVKEIDNTYLPLAKEAEAVAVKIRDAMDAFDTAELRKVQEAERLAQEARAKAEREAAEAAKAGKPVAPLPEPPPAPAPYVPQQVRGAYGRAASTKIVKTITEVTDWMVLFTFLKDHPEFKELAMKLAQRAVDKNFDVPGVKIEDRVRNT